MPKQKLASVLEIGSSSLRAVVASSGVNDTLSIKGSSEIPYAGYFEGEFVSPEELTDNIKDALTIAENDAKICINELFVGVPSEFSTVICKTVSNSYGARKVITEIDVAELFDLASEKMDFETLVSVSPLYFILDDGRKTTEVIGERSSKLTATLSLVYAQNSFIENVNACLKELEIIRVEYVCEPLSTAMIVLSKEERERMALLVDVGYLTTSISLVKGDGLVALSSFSIGGGHISTDLSEALDISFEESEELKEQIVLSISPKAKGIYQIVREDYVKPIDMQEANMAVRYRIELIASAINKCLQLIANEEPSFIPVHLTGGGITYIKGAKDYLAKCMGRNVILAAAELPSAQRSELSTRLGLVKTALGVNLKKTSSLFAKLFKR